MFGQSHSRIISGSGPLTLLQQASRLLPDLPTRTRLTVHIVGAGIYEMMGLIKWEYLAHRLPALKRLELVFVGPELEDEAGEAVVPQCGDCQEAGRTLQYYTQPTTYQQFRQEKRDMPDLVLVQNCGFSEFSEGEEGWEEGWAGLRSVLLPASPLIFTSYTQSEAEADLARLLSVAQQEVEVVIRCQENPMRSHRPIRNWECDHDRDVFYSNQYISVVKLAE